MKIKALRILPVLLIGMVFCLPSHAHAQTTLIDSLITAERIRATIEFLASDSLKGRITGSRGAMTAANFIQDEFRKAGLQPPDSSGYLKEFTAGVKYGMGYNVIGFLPGTNSLLPALVFSAHYDHVGTVSTNPYTDEEKRPMFGDTTFNGANDNASGTAALISLAHYFGTIKGNTRPIFFIAFSGEELGLIGSRYFLSRIPDPSIIACVLNLEMLGRGRRPFITGSEYGNLQNLLNKELARVDKKRYGKNFFMRDRYPDEQLFKRSDNYPFAQFQIPAHTIMVTSSADRFYHSVDDEPKTLDFHLVQIVTRAIALAVAPMVEGRITPRRIYTLDDRQF